MTGPWASSSPVRRTPYCSTMGSSGSPGSAVPTRSIQKLPVRLPGVPMTVMEEPATSPHGMSMVKWPPADLEAFILRTEYGQSLPFSVPGEAAFWTVVVKFSHAVLASLIASIAWGRPVETLVSCFIWSHVSSQCSLSVEEFLGSRLFESSAGDDTICAFAGLAAGASASTRLLSHARGLAWRIW